MGQELFHLPLCHQCPVQYLEKRCQALCFALYTHYLSHDSAQPYEVGIPVTPISQLGKPELREVKSLTEEGTANNNEKKNYLLQGTFSAKCLPSTVISFNPHNNLMR